jgi:hypothetical protein
MKIQSFLAGITTLFLFSCEKSIDFKLKDTASKLVVEATIENDKPPMVILTNSVGYFSEISPEILANSFVHNADVLVSNGSFTHKLKEYRIPTGNNFAFYYYSTDSSNLGTAFLGELNHSYSLQVDVEGKVYTANTTIPAITKKIDSLWWKPAPGTSDTNKVIIMVRATDKPGYGDYIRYFTKRNRESFYPPLNSVFDDLFIDGTTYELQVEPGVDRNAERTDEDHYFNRGDTVSFKLSNIDKATYDFWRTMEFSYQSVGNPFSTPTKVLSNISNNALGYFGGYGSQYRTLIIPH